MIKATELRIGNWVKLGKDFEYVYQIIYDMRDGYSINHKDYKEDWLEPVVLSPEILEKAGFKRDGAYWSHPYLNLATALTKNGGEVILVPNSKYAMEVKYIHQLQNLIFALSGEELTITL